MAWFIPSEIKKVSAIEVYEVSSDIYILCVFLIVACVMGASSARRDKESG